MSIPRFLLITFVCVLSSCISPTSTINRIVDEKIAIDPMSAALIVQPTDGGIGEKTYPGSGAKTAFEFARAFKTKVSKIELSASQQDNESAVAYAKANGFHYVVILQIAHWEDRATQWSSIPDRVEIQITLVETETGKALDTSLATANTSDFEAIDRPVGEMVRKLAEQYVENISVK